LIADGEIQKFEIQELLSVFRRIFTLPIDFSGFGKAQFHVEGPLQLGKLSYQLNTSIQQGVIAGESFDSLQVQLQSQAGEMKIQNALLMKGRKQVRAEGLSHPDGSIDILMNGKGLALEESENISKLGTQISGLLDVQTKLQGHILSPDISLSASIHQLIVDEQEFDPSKMELEITKKSLSGTTNLFADQLQSKFMIPLQDDLPFELNLKAKNWNYTTLLALIGGGSLLKEYQASLTGDLELNSSRGGLWVASGKGQIRDLLLQRGNLKLRNNQPMDFTMNDGSISLANFRIGDERTFVEVQGKNISKENLNLRIESQAQLRLFQIFVPFLEELNGSSSIAAEVSGPLLKPEVLGNAEIRDSFIKIKGFPHAFEKIESDIQFSQSKVFINSVTGNLAGGSLQGEGAMMIEGPQNLPTSIKATLKNVSLNVPDQVRTSGNAELTFTGNWFPFQLAGTYHVQGGAMTKELTEDSAVNNLKQSSYLPKIILQGAFEPILLDLNIIIEKPLTIKNSLVEGNVSGSIQVKGTPNQPLLGGQVRTEKGTKAIFRDKVFDIQTGSVQFTQEADINPRLYVEARSRIDEYDINMLIQGNAKNPAIKLSSLPPLSDQDIISLIALGVKSQTLERQVQAGNKAKEDTMQGVALGVFTQTGPLKKLQETAGVQLQFSTSYDDTRNVSVQRVTLSKKLTDRVRASATQTSASSSSSNEYSLQYNLTENLSAIGRYEDRRYNENSSSVDANRESQSILGLDLEFKREFR
jgi:translocation and assembly module TamB